MPEELACILSSLAVQDKPVTTSEEDLCINKSPSILEKVKVSSPLYVALLLIVMVVIPLTVDVAVTVVLAGILAAETGIPTKISV